MAQDPTISETYIALRNALLAIQDDSSAVLSVLSSLSDNGVSWVATAYYELRRSLVQGRLQEAETVGGLIGLVLDVQEKGADDELAENRIHRESMQWLIEGIGTILNEDNQTGIKHLTQLTEAVYCNESLQWVAWLWMARAATNEGNLDLAMKAAREAMALAKGIDPLANGTSLTTAGEIEFLQGDSETALKHIVAARATFEEVGEQRGMAMASLTLARMLVQMDREAEGLEAAAEAQKADLDWEEPAIFLSRQALIKGEIASAEEFLQPFFDANHQPPQLNRQISLLKIAKEGKVSLKVIDQYLKQKMSPPKKKELAALKKQWEKNKNFLQLRELLAWNLLKLGKEKEAVKHFEAMSELDLDAEIHASVLLGLGCLANRKFEHRQPAARVKAASSAARKTKKSSELAPLPVRESLLDETVVPEHGSGTYAAVPGSGPKAVFTGDLQLFAVPDLLEFLKSSRRTGTLVVTSESGIGAVHLHQGMITGAASPNCTNMGDLLLQQGALSEEKLLSAADFQRADSPERLLGSILLEKDLVDHDTLMKVLVQQIKGAIKEMVGWISGRFAFEPDKRSQIEEDSEISIKLDTQEVLLDVLREIDEQNR